MVTSEKQVIVYYPNWYLGSKKAAEGGEVGSIAWEDVTMVNHAFFAPYPDDIDAESSFERRAKGLDARTAFKCVSTNPSADFGDMTKSEYNDSPRNHFAQYEIYAGHYPEVKIMISVGGWSRSGFFSEMCHTAKGRASFISSLVELLKKYPFIAGIDIDWEYPAGSVDGERQSEGTYNEGCPIWESAASDNANFTLLLSEMRAEFDKEFGKGGKLITACACASAEWALKCQDWQKFAQHLDYINIMTYDLTGTWAEVTGHHSPANLTRKIVEYFIDQKTDMSKVNIGSPMYPIWMKMKGDVLPENIIGAPTIPGAIEKIDANTDADILMLKQAYDIDATQRFEREGSSGWTAGFDDEAGAAYLYNSNPESPYYMWFASYENLKSLKCKIDIVHQYKLAGIIVWESAQDTPEHMMVGLMRDGLLRRS